MPGKNTKLTSVECLKRTAWILFAIIIGYLLIASIFSSCYLGAYSYNTASGATEINREHTFYIRDCFLQHFVVFALFSFLLVFGKLEKLKKIISGRYFGIAVCVAAGIVSALIVIAGQYAPKYDQRHVIEAAARLNQHIYTDFEPGDYLFVFPFQTGVVLYFQLLSFLFGNGNHVVFQIVNCLWIALVYYFFMKIAEILWGGAKRLSVMDDCTGDPFFALSDVCHFPVRDSGGDGLCTVGSLHDAALRKISQNAISSH